MYLWIWTLHVVYHAQNSLMEFLNIMTISIVMSCFIVLNDVQSFETEIPNLGPSPHRRLRKLYLSMHSLAWGPKWMEFLLKWGKGMRSNDLEVAFTLASLTTSWLHAWYHTLSQNVHNEAWWLESWGNAMLYSQVICVGRATPCHKVCGCLWFVFPCSPTSSTNSIKCVLY